MTKNVNSNTPKQKSGLLIKIISAILILFAILCTLLLFEDSSSALVITIVGVIMLVITMNVADHLKVNKHNAKTFTIISIVLNLLSIIFAFKQLIFSFVLTVPALMISNKCRKCDIKNKFYLFSFLASLVFFIVYIILFIIR